MGTLTDLALLQVGDLLWTPVSSHTGSATTNDTDTIANRVVPQRILSIDRVQDEAPMDVHTLQGVTTACWRCVTSACDESDGQPPCDTVASVVQLCSTS